MKKSNENRAQGEHVALVYQVSNPNEYPRVGAVAYKSRSRYTIKIGVKNPAVVRNDRGYPITVTSVQEGAELIANLLGVDVEYSYEQRNNWHLED
jgi:hypothetical protein